MIRTLQQRGVAPGHRRATWSARSRALLKDGDRDRRRASATGARPAASCVFEAQGGRARHRRHRQGAGRSPRTPGSTPATATRWRCDAGADADQHGVRPVPPDRHGLAAVGARHPGHRGRARRRRHPEELRRRAVHVRLHPRVLQGRDGRHRGGGRPLVRRTRRTTAARPSCSRATRSPARSTAEIKAGRGIAARRRLPRHRLAPHRRSTSSASACRRCTTSSRSWPTSTSPRSRWRSARPATT